eukprot:Sspe_Gene.34647::Locus_16828_Transcript_2_2_Confidence_0.667_Length_2483::g.34647::m.34647/K16296/SCPL-I; serine carboxypeptidase-like clade I
MLRVGIACLLGVAVVQAAVQADLVTSLPGWDGALPSKHYSGYLTFGPNNRKHIHYYFVESTGKDPADPSTPTVLWMNGGPGCSSLDGWYYEHGPFLGSKDDPKKLVINEHGWNKVANTLYIEAPLGVGFSYSDDPDTDYKQDDDKSSQDNMNALKVFFNLFPELKSHPFYITGESYAGVYVPTLAEAILWEMNNGTWTGARLHGIAVGNGCTGSQIGVCGGQRDQYDTEYLLQTAFLSKKLKAQISGACKNWENVTSECHNLVQEMQTVVSNVNLYNIYGECIRGLPESQSIRKAPLGPSKYFGAHVGGPDACIDSRGGTAYFTQPGIETALHVKPISFKWATCATAPGWSYNSNRPNLPRDTYPALISNFRVLIYNGDWDACVPYTDNEAWTEGMGYPVLDEWHPWKYASKDDKSLQVGGYATRYAKNNFTFITIRGGRHEVPETAPWRALSMLSKLLNGEQF